MSPATLSLLALLVVITLSLTSRVNVGVLAVALAFPVGVFAAGWKPEAVLALFPSALFLTLAGVTLLFGIAQENGTLRVLASRGVQACGGSLTMLPPLFFSLSCLLSMIGPGAIAASALVAPLAMSAVTTSRISPFLMALMVGNGANAGNLSPFSAVGVIVQAQMLKAGLAHHDWSIFAANFVAHALVALAAYFLFGGRKLLGAPRVAFDLDAAKPLEGRQWLTLGVLGAWIAGVMLFQLNPGLSAFAAAALLVLARTCDDQAAIASVPWAVLLMVSGVSVLVGVLEKSGGMDLFTTLLAQTTTVSTVNGAMAFITGLISTYSSTSGVVYPAFLPTVPGLVAKLGGGNPLEIALSINVGAAIVDVSPLSTIGALCIAALPAGADAKRIFRQMLLWGFSMTIVGALFCQFFIHFFA